MQHFRFQRTVCLLLALWVLWIALPGAAVAESSIALEDIGMRYFLLENESCITRDQFQKEALDRLGVDEATALAAMERDDLFLICITPEGRQVSLRCQAKPSGMEKSNLFELDGLEKEQFLTLLARSGHYLSASWQSAVPGFALFSTADENSADANSPFHTISISTLYLDRIYSFQTAIIGRVPTEADLEPLFSVANRALFLGAAKAVETPLAEAPLSLSGLESSSTGNASFAETIGAIPLSLSPIPATLPTNMLTLSGATSASAFLRYSVNGRTSSRFKPEKDGSFSVSVPNLDTSAPNEVEVTAFDSASASTIRFSVAVDWQDTPLALSQTTGETAEESLTLRGLTLPNTKVQLVRRSGTATVPVAEDGSFTCQIPLKKVGVHTVSVTAQAAGYRRREVQVTLQRTGDPKSDTAALRRKVKSVNYEKLTQSPSAYEGKTVEYQGVVKALANEGGAPLFLLENAQGQGMLCLCENLLGVELGQTLSLIGALTGQSQSLQTRWASGTYPTLKLLAVLP